jgi:uncharacterized protein YbcC (UPF0753/DUF2309 family)
LIDCHDRDFMQADFAHPDPAALPPGTVPDRAPSSPRPLDAQAAFDARAAAACDEACATIAPSWPLDRSIAVNPHWGRIERPVREVAARMALFAGIRVFPPRGEMRCAWQQGRITAADLDQALRQLPAAQAAALSADRCVRDLEGDAFPQRLPLLIDVLDDAPNRYVRLSWRQAITQQVSQTCASFFDEHQADWQPRRGDGLYAFWRDTLAHDHGIGILMGLPDLSQRLYALPATAADAQRLMLQRLDLPEAVWPDYLEAVLLTVNGWASWCAYLGWQARLEGRHDPHLRDLLAIRLAWGAIVLESRDDADARRAFSALKVEWACVRQRLAQAGEALLVDEVWQLAMEIGYRRQLMRRLAWASPSAPATDVEVQAVFCIDVRSEPLRRALEATWPAIQTIGFAGFFGLPLAYTPLATTARRPQLPGLLAPSLEAVDRVGERAEPAGGDDTPLQLAAVEARRRRIAWDTQWSAASRWPQSAFSFVEAAGVGYLGKLSRWLRPAASPCASGDLAGLPARYRRVCRPTLQGLGLDAKVSHAATILHAMGLDGHQAPLVLLVGHGSQSENNAHAAALNCGACCGQTGEVNARVLAGLLNDRAVRAGLRQRGIAIAAETTFVAALHNTTTDDIEGLALDGLPPPASRLWDRLKAVLAQAGDQVRRERAVALGLDPRAGHGQLRTAVRRRANDGAQTRPEWGLAGNASFIIAPRHRTSGVVLDGRSFLHDYDAARDEDGSLLEALMTAPMLVTHWINWQYHASTSDPDRLGSGNKVLHNVVGGRIGVFEGNGGDLRIGLARQSLNDGVRWMHEPLRLTVVIEACVEAIERVIGRHDVVRQLLDNGWLHLLAIEGDAEPVFRRRRCANVWERES